MLDKNISSEYEDFIDKYGIISQDGIEIYGYKENIDENILPSVTAATKLYKKDYNLNEDELVICFDEFLNCPIVLDNKNNIYNVFLDRREQIFNSFDEWFENIQAVYKLDIK